MTQLYPVKTGLALGLTFGIVSLVCAILVFLFPPGMLALANSIFHGIAFSATASLSMAQVLYGVLATFGIGFVGGWLFGVIHNWIHR